jgi:hypothetical protein
MLVALRVGVAVLGAGQTIWAAMRSPLICIIVAPLLAVPATIAGYHASLGLAAPAEGLARSTRARRRGGHQRVKLAFVVGRMRDNRSGEVRIAQPDRGIAAILV